MARKGETCIFRMVPSRPTLHQLTAPMKLPVSFFPAGNDTPAIAAQPWELEFIFGSDEKVAAFELLDYSLTTAPVWGVNASSIYKFTKADGQVDFQGHDKNAFKCSNSDLPLSNSSTIDLKNVNVLAFAHLDQPEFPKQQSQFFYLFFDRHLHRSVGQFFLIGKVYWNFPYMCCVLASKRS
ncbi:unnamed protein product [Cylicostephanus goldi]|uniref:Uncharacterized protein n=1 Tax=Cylicostephanus goldi TaxID=71465 RepID=A0A3P7N845_CYLGO|nr:unnamed protein product [Cylicostephanus goldi]